MLDRPRGRRSCSAVARFIVASPTSTFGVARVDGQRFAQRLDRDRGPQVRRVAFSGIAR